MRVVVPDQVWVGFCSDVHWWLVGGWWFLAACVDETVRSMTYSGVGFRQCTKRTEE